VDLDLVFFGTSGSVPTAQRAPSALLIRRGSERLLFDCAEGTQRQMLRSTVGLVELREVFLTHYHADHYLGLPGMLKTFALRGREIDLTVYGPPGLADLFGALKRIFGKLTYRVELHELEPGDVLERDGYNLVTFAPAHGVSAVAESFNNETRPGRFEVDAADELVRVVVIADGLPNISRDPMDRHPDPERGNPGSGPGEEVTPREQQR